MKYLFFFVLAIIFIILSGYAYECSFIVNSVNYAINGENNKYSEVKIILSNGSILGNILLPNALSKSSILSFLVTLFGGIVGLFLLYLSFKRFNQTQEQINLTEDNNLNTTFKDAITLLGSESTLASMSGVYTLIDIAINKPDKYAKRINDILCNYIVEETNKEHYNTRHIQKLVDLVLIENSSTFNDYKKDLSNSKFINIKFKNNEKVVINKVIFQNNLLKKCKFENIKFETCWFIVCDFLLDKHCSPSFIKCQLNNCTFVNNKSNTESQLHKSYIFFKEGNITNCTFKLSIRSDNYDIRQYINTDDEYGEEYEDTRNEYFNCLNLYFDVDNIKASNFHFTESTGSKNRAGEEELALYNSIKFKKIDLEDCNFFITDKYESKDMCEGSIDDMLEYFKEDEVNEKNYYQQAIEYCIEFDIEDSEDIDISKKDVERNLRKEIFIKNNLSLNDKLFNIHS
jgi:hypothetical protein